MSSGVIRQVLGVAAAAVTLYFTEDYNAAFAAYTIVAGVSSLVIKDPNQQVRGPKLSDLTVQQGTFGGSIPELRGAFRIPGNIIFSSDKIAIDTTETQGGKGGGGGTDVTTTRYVVDCAISFLSTRFTPNATTFGRVWMDKTLVFSFSSLADAATQIASANIAANIRFYDGSDTQLPDPLIEAYKGTGNVSAYRGTCYIVFDKLEITRYGNRIPNIEVELICDGTTDNLHTNFARLSAADDGGTANLRGRSWSTLNRVVAWRPLSSGDVNTMAFFESLDGEGFQPRGVAHIAAGSSNEYFPVNTRDLCLIETVVFVTIPATGDLAQFIQVYQPFVGDIADPGVVGYPLVANLVVGQVFTSDNSVQDNLRFLAYDQDTQFYAFGIRSFSGGFYRDRVTFFPGVTEGNHYNFRPLGTEHNTVCCALTMANGLCYALIYHGDTDGVMRLHVIDQPTATVLDIFDGPTLTPSAGADVLATLRTDGSTVWAYSDATVWKWDALGNYTPLATGVGLENDSSTITAILGGSQAYIGDNFLIGQGAIQAIGGDPADRIWRHQIIAWNVPTATTVLLSDIVQNHMDRRGIACDVTELTDVVNGSLVTKQMSSADYLNFLASVYQFDGQPDGSSIFFKKRGGASVCTITTDEMAAHDFGAAVGDAFPLTHAKEEDNPRDWNINFTDIDNADQPGSVPSKRQNTQSEQIATIDITALRVTATFAKRVVEVYRATSVVERDKYAFSTNYKYKYLQPADCVDVDDGDGLIRRVRLTKVTDQAGLLQFEAVADDPTAYEAFGIAIGGPPQSQTISIPGPTDLDFLDMPIVRDIDDNTGFYAALGPVDATRRWPGANLFQLDAPNPSRGRVTRYAKKGYARTALGDFDGTNIFDTINTVDVRVTHGETLSSCTRARARAGDNLCLWGKELGNFCDATLIDTDTYRLSNLLRYRFGTEGVTHAVGDRFVQLATDGLLRIDNGASDIGISHEYRAVTIGRNEHTGQTQLFTNTAKGKKPRSPVSLRLAHRDGVLVLSWHRRSRLSGRLGVPLPLGEDTESYEVEIASDSAFANVVSVLPTTTTSVDYTNDERALGISLGVVGTFYWRVYQISATVGRGVPSEVSQGDIGTPTPIVAPPPSAPPPIGPGSPPTVIEASVPELTLFDGTDFIAWKQTSDSAGIGLYTSTDGQTFALTQPGGLGPGNQLAFNGSLYVANLSSHPWTSTSTDLITWSSALNPVGWISGLALWDGTQWVKLVYGPNLSTYIYTSSTGLNNSWVQGVELKGAYILKLFGSAYYAVVQNAGIPSVYRSTDLTTWTQLSSTVLPSNSYGYYDICYDGTAWVLLGFQPNAFSLKPLVYRSTDGTTFSDVSSGLPILSSGPIVFGSNIVAICAGGFVVSTDHGSTFTQHSFTAGPQRLVGPMLVGSGKLVVAYGDVSPTPIGGGFVQYVTKDILETTDLSTWNISSGGSLTAT